MSAPEPQAQAARSRPTAMDRFRGTPSEPGERPPPVVNVPGRRRPLVQRMRELWDYRHLVGNLVVRDLKVRYKGSVLGFLWSMASPLLMMLVFWLLFGVLFRSSANPPST